MPDNSQLLYRNGDRSAWYHPSPNGKTFTIEHKGDSEPILDLNKARQNSGVDGYNMERNQVHVASIPMALVQKWYQEEGWFALSTHDPYVCAKLRRKLNDPEYAYLRTNGMRI